MAYIPLMERDLVFVDCETSALDPARGEILEFAAIRQVLPFDLKDDGSPVIEPKRISFKVVPQHLDTADVEALKINGYSDEKWADAIPQTTAAQRIAEFCRDATMVAHNAPFDRSFIMAMLKKRLGNFADRAMPYHGIDTVGLAYVQLVPKGLQRLNLEALCDFLGVTNEAPHTAAGDVEACYRCYYAMKREAR